MRLIPRSLYGRMLLVSVTTTLVALLIAGIVIGSVLGRFVTEGLDRRLDAELALLASAIDADGHVDRARIRQRAGALDAGPDWHWRITGPDGTIGSADFPSLQDRPPPPRPGPAGGPEDNRPAPLDGVDDTGSAVHARQLIVPSSRGAVTLTAAAPRAVVERPIRGAIVPLLATLVALAALLSAALLVQLRVGLRPLRRLRDQVADIRSGDRARIEENQPLELQPLADELNALTADNAAALAAARASAANLAHALKTPVATLAIDAGDQPQLMASVARIERTIRHHLSRARADAINRRVRTPVRPVVDDLAAAVLRLHPDRTLAIDIDIPDSLTAAVDPQDLAEILGNLLDNSARSARARIAVAAMRSEREIRLTVTDDGPGIPLSQRARVSEPGMRLDESGDGHGFGLAIVTELVSLYGGTLHLDDAPGGGLSVRLTFPH